MTDPYRSLRLSACPPDRFIGEGFHVVRKMLRETDVESLLLTPEGFERLKEWIPPAAEVRIQSKEEQSGIVGFHVHRGIFAIGRIPSPLPFREGVVMALDGISSADNVGAILRNCAAFGVGGVVIGPTTASPWLRRAVRVGMGAPLHVPLRFAEDLPRALRELGLPIFSAHIHGWTRSLEEIDLPYPCVLVLGGEDKGVSQEVLAISDEVLYIPMAEGWDCINVAASSAVFLYAAAFGRGRSRVRRREA